MIYYCKIRALNNTGPKGNIVASREAIADRIELSTAAASPKDKLFVGASLFGTYTLPKATLIRNLYIIQQPFTHHHHSFYHFSSVRK